MLALLLLALTAAEHGFLDRLAEAALQRRSWRTRSSPTR